MGRRGLGQHQFPVTWCGGKNDSLSQVDGFLNGPAISLSSSWHRAVNEFLDTREKQKRSKSRGRDGSMGQAAVNLLDDDQGQWARGHLSRCNLG